MDKGGGLGSMAKGLGGKISKISHLKDKVVSAGNKVSDKASDIKDKAVSAGNKVSDKASDITQKAKSLESSVKDKLNLPGKSDDVKSKLFKGINKIKSFDDNISGKQAKSRIRDELLDGKSVVNKYGLFGPGTYKYLIYIILFLNICCIILLTFNKNIFYKYAADTPVDVRLNKNVFYVYIFSLFLFILQLYILKENYNDIVERRGKYQTYVEAFNILCTLGLTYFIYKQIDFINTPCPEPNENVCVVNKNGPNDIHECPNGSFQCGNKTYKAYLPPVVDSNKYIAKNFYLIPPIITCESFACPEGINQKDDPDKIICKDPPCNASECCVSTEQSSDNTQSSDNIQKMINDTFNNLIKPDEERIKNLETRFGSLSPGEGIPGPAGPAGPPGTPGSDTRSDITSPSSNQFSNILCPNEPGGLCKDGETGCDDKGMCEGFALISLQDKIDLELRYKDLNNNTYKVNNLMNNLETFLLNSLK